MIRVDNLTKEYGDVRAVSGLSFEVLEGEILGFLGPNGAGKTTTMRILTCFFPPTSGAASVAGFDVVAEPHEVRRIIGYLPEGVPLYRDMTVSSALDFIAHAKGFGGSDRRRHTDAAIEETGLGDVRNRIIGHLSKGYRQRVGLAQAIIGEPKVLILDEPTVGLDPRQIAEVRSLIRNMAGRRTVILSTHILPEVQMTCSKVIILSRGRIAASGTAERLTSQMQHGLQCAVRVAGPADRVLAALREIPDVATVEACEAGSAPDHQGIEYLVHSHAKPHEIMPELASAVVSHGWRVLELRQVGLTLEDLFLRVVAGDTDGAEPPTDQPSETEAADGA
jgi:ABC-2 type transport system ATP-binding protein